MIKAERLLEHEVGRCDSCPEQAVLALGAQPEGPVINGNGVVVLLLCQQCAIKAEALLRGSRKGGTRVGNWGAAERARKEGS